MTTGTRAATRPASPRRTRSSPQRLDPVLGGRRLANYLSVLTLEAQTIARACGKSHVHNLEPEDLVALTVEAAAMAQVPLAGTNWIPGSEVRTDELKPLEVERRGNMADRSAPRPRKSAGSSIS